MNDTYSGHYPIERRAGEIERLDVQSQAMAPETKAMLDRFGPMQGWSCLDVGCGPGGITSLLSARVGASGRVVGIDMDARFIEHARQNAAANVEFRQTDAYSTDLPAEEFDLVHMRFVASTAGGADRLIREALRLAKPSGIVAFQEPEGSTLNCYPPHPAWDRLKDIYTRVFERVGSDIQLGRHLYHIGCQAGLHDVQYRTSMLAVRAGDPMVDYLPSTVESLRGTVLRLGLLSEHELDRALVACRRHLARPNASFTMYTLAQVWGRKGFQS